MSLLLAILCLMVISILYAIYIIISQFIYWKSRKVPYIKPVPILGNNYPIYFKTSSFAMHSLSLYKKYPKARYYGFFDFRVPNIIVKDPELIRDICIKNFDHFTDHDSFVTTEMDPIFGRNLFELKGQNWKNFRNTLNPSYTASRMKLLFELISECSQNCVQYFLDNKAAAKSLEANETFSRYTMDVIATSAFGIKTNSFKDRENEFYKHGDATHDIGSPLWVLKIIFLSNFPKIMRFFGTTFFPKHVDTFLRQVIQETIKIRTENNIVRPDMLQMLINAMNKKDGNVDVTIDDILGQSYIFFTAGFETSSVFLSFIALELAANPEVQEKLHQEIDGKFAEDENVTYESLVDLKYLDMVMNETLRKYPPAAVTNRRCTKDCVLPPPMEGYPECRLEKNTAVTIPIYAIHHDPNYYPEPEKFDPERFNEENKHKITPYTYLPFGVGPRQCIGFRIATMETKILIIQLMRKFVIKFSKVPKMPIEFSKKSFILTSNDGIWLKFEERKKYD